MGRILIIQIQPYAYPGIYYICGALRFRNHDYKVIATDNQAEIAECIRTFEPDLIGFPCLTGIHREVLRVAGEIKEVFPQSLILLGGIHPTLFPQVLADKNIDFICRGEGEWPTCELLEAIVAGASQFNIPNISWKHDDVIENNEMRDLIDPLDSLPLPDYSIYSDVSVIANDTYPAVFMTRGCPFSCTYCHNSNQKQVYQGKGIYVRTFSIDRILTEVKEVLKCYPKARAIFFGADTLGTNLVWLRQLLTRYHKRFNLPYTCLIRPEFINEDLVKLLKETGCHMIAFGIESGSEKIRKEILGRYYSNDQIIKSAELLRRYGIKFRTYNMVGLPTETREQMLETLELNIKIRPDFPWCSIYTPYPETKLANLSIASGCLDHGYSYDDIPTSFFNGSILKNIDNNFILNLHALFQLTVLFPALYPLVKKIMSWPHSDIFRFVFKVVYSVVSIRSENRSVYSFVRLAFANRKLFK